MSELRSIVYVSHAVRPLTDAELEALLMQARGLNRETRITGVLLYSEGAFMQCFEGSEEAVALTFKRIRASRKHDGLIVLIDEAVPARDFGDWQMGFVRARRSELLALSSARWQTRLDQAGAGADMTTGMHLLKDFWERQRR